MKKIEMNYEEKANTDKLLFYYSEKVNVHIILKRQVSSGKNSFLNGLITNRLNERLWVLKDRELGEVRLSISEIAPGGVKEFREVSI